MATNNRGGNRRSGRNNNPDGRNQYSGVMGTARGNPLAAAMTVGGAVAAGLFLWSRRNEISEQIAILGEQISDWREGRDTDTSYSSSSASSGRTQAEIAEEALTLKETGSTA